MADLASVKKKITVESTRFRSAVSEFFAQTLGKSMNYLIDRQDALETAVEATPFTNVSFTVGGFPALPDPPLTVPAGETWLMIFYNMNTAAAMTWFQNGGTVTIAGSQPVSALVAPAGYYFSNSTNVTVAITKISTENVVIP